MATIDTHRGGPFDVWYVSVYGYHPPPTVDSNASRYLAWQQGVPRSLAAVIPYGAMGPPGIWLPGAALVTSPTSPLTGIPAPAPAPPPPAAPVALLPFPAGTALLPPSPGAPSPAAGLEPVHAPIGEASDLGTFLSTAYGPPWTGINGTGTTKTGVDLRDAPHRYIVAVDPSVIPLHTKLIFNPNPFNDDSIVFSAEDTGTDIVGKRIDFYDWRGRTSQYGWGRRNVHAFRADAAETPAQVLYYNPLMHASVTAERIDQGVDYAGTGDLVAIADANISSVAPNAWAPFGNFMEYKITQDGPLKDVYVFYAEGVTPLVQYGEHVQAGQRIAHLIPGWHSGIEIGFGAGVSEHWTYFRYHDGSYGPYDSESAATRPGIAFSNLVHALGGPPGRIEGPVVGKFPQYLPTGVIPSSINPSPQGFVPSGGLGGPLGAPGSAKLYDWPAALYSAFVQVQRGADAGSHHSHSAWDYLLGVSHVEQAT